MDQNREFVSKLCNLEIPSDIKISPRGDKILYSTGLTWGHVKGKVSVSTLWLATFGEANSSKQITNGKFKDHSPAWHPSNDEIAFISDRAGSGTKSAIYRMLLTGTTNPVPLTLTENEQAIETFKFSPDGEMIAFISKDEKTEEEKGREERKEDVQVWGEGYRFSRLRIVDLTTREIRTLPLDKHILDFCWMSTKSVRSEVSEIAFVCCNSTFIEHPYFYGTEIHTASSDLKVSVKVCSLPKRANELTWGSTNGGRSNELYFWSNANMGKNFSGSRLYKVSLGGLPSKYERIHFENDVNITGIEAVDGHIVVKAHHRLQDCLISVGHRELYSCDQEIEAHDVASGFLDGNLRMVIATSDVNNPIEVFSVEGDDGRKVQLSQHGKLFEGQQFGNYKVLTCPTTNDPNVEIDGIYLEPVLPHGTVQAEATPRKSSPTVVLIHGGPTTRVTNSFNTLYYMLTPYLLRLGYAILMPNYRGSSGRGEEFASAVYGRVGTVEYADIITLTQHAIEKGYADANRIVVGGYSHGGLVSNLCALRNGSHGYGWKFKAAISGASISDIDGMSLASDMGNIYHVELQHGEAPWTTGPNDTTARTGSALWAFKEAMERSSRDGSMVVPPMLLLHGANDERIHVSQAWGMRRALEHYSLPFEMVIYPRQGHVFHEQTFWIDLVLRTGRWVETYIG